MVMWFVCRECILSNFLVYIGDEIRVGAQIECSLIVLLLTESESFFFYLIMLFHCVILQLLFDLQFPFVKLIPDACVMV